MGRAHEQDGALTMASNKSQECQATWHNLSQTNDRNKPRHEMENAKLGMEMEMAMGIRMGRRSVWESSFNSRMTAPLARAWLGTRRAAPCRVALKRLLVKRIFISISCAVARWCEGFGRWNGKWNQLLNFPQSRRSEAQSLRAKITWKIYKMFSLR